VADHDVVIVGAGGDGPVAAWKLGAAGLDVLVLEAGPFHGNENWPKPHEEPGAESSSDPADLSGELLDEQFTTRELEMSSDKLLFGPADHERGLWLRKQPQDGALLQCSGVGGTTLHYTGNHPRAFPAAIDEQPHWPDEISYADLIPYYEAVEELVEVAPAPVTAKEDLFFQGCLSAERPDADETGWDLLDVKNVTEPGWRPQPNAVKQPDEKLFVDSDYDGDFTYPDVEGSTLASAFIAGNPHPIGAPFEEKAKRATNVSFVPLAMETGNVTIRPNAFAVDVTTNGGSGDPEATGVTFRDTWSGGTETATADVVVLAAGAIETPRLWLNAGLPDNGWVGKGMTLHYGDSLQGIWAEGELEERLGGTALDPQKGQNIAARFDYPGLGAMQTTGQGPGVSTILGYGASSSGFSALNEVDPDEPWDTRGRIVGEELKRVAADYRRTLNVLILTDDRPQQRNGVSVQEGVEDEHGPIPIVDYEPSEATRKRRDELARIAARILRGAGAERVHRSDAPPTGIHIHSTMAMGKVLDTACEAYDVSRLFVADHSALANSLGGPNPTNTGQALAARTAEKIVERYF
jgi:choline dehydrogenase-like flavoprotein